MNVNITGSGEESVDLKIQLPVALTRSKTLHSMKCNNTLVSFRVQLTVMFVYRSRAGITSQSWTSENLVEHFLSPSSLKTAGRTSPTQQRKNVQNHHRVHQNQ
ncbi:hypothetical protein GOODEAATRI_012918 [Goodea atripinnis]|uniref:Uncharacterized protein n=1 Tax=Goodea atripinnis TaxID=208336 RepID=A0ABV0NJT0_9TELE